MNEPRNDRATNRNAGKAGAGTDASGDARPGTGEGQPGGVAIGQGDRASAGSMMREDGPTGATEDRSSVSRARTPERGKGQA